ncbi:MAG: DUF3592 domain-containing protein [Clostridia bacterium]|nr:DUF3592 domain-containing protein [Clostridia bacterium]
MNTVKKPAIILISISIALLILSFVFTILQITVKRKYELDYERVTATITGVNTEHVQGHTRYYFCYSFEVNGNTYKVQDGSGISFWQARNYKSYLEKQVEIYYDLKNPNKVVSVDSSDTFSLVSVTFFSFTVILYTVGAMLLLHKSNNAWLKRFLVIWLPISIISIASALLFSLALPTGGFSDVFKEISGSIGYTVIAGASVLAVACDSLINIKAKKERIL